MKQRLLLSLLMLLVSVGWVKAQSQYIDLSIPAGTSGKVTITIKNTEAVLKADKDAPYYPLVYYPAGKSVVPTISTDKKTATYAIS